MASIEQWRTPVKVSGGLAYHYSWVRKDDVGNIVDRFDGWPTKPDGKPDTESTGYGRPLKVHSIPMEGEKEPMGTFTGTRAEIERRWDAGEAARQAIDANPPTYRPLDEIDLETKDLIPATNSNSVHATIGKAMGFDTSDQVGGSAPGMNRQLLPDDFTPPRSKLPPATLTRPGKSPQPQKVEPSQQEQNGAIQTPEGPPPLPQGSMSNGEPHEQLAQSPKPSPAPAPAPKQKWHPTDPQLVEMAGKSVEDLTRGEMIDMTILSAEAGNDTLLGGGGSDHIEAPADPQVAAMVEMAGKSVDNPGRSALLKPVENLTQDEMIDMIKHAQSDYRGWKNGDPLKYHTYEKVQDWHVKNYGDAPQQTDGGKPIEPQPIRPIPEQISPHTTPKGEDLWQATGRLGQKVAAAVQADGYTNAVKALQRGLNMLNQANPLGTRSPAYGPYTKLAPVAEDGKYGPQTDFALKHATARLGPDKVENGLALGRFNQFARTAQKNGTPDGLEAKVHAIFGPLFRNQTDTTTPKVEAGGLQETLNDMGSQDDDWTPLKVDDWIGPKTTKAFDTVLKKNDADSLTSAFGHSLKLL